MQQAETFYHQLKQLRIAQGINLEDIAETTRINVRFLEALERGEFEILPKTYIRLFLRTYCRGIGANETEILEQLEEHLGEPEDLHTTIFEDLSATISSQPAGEKPVKVELRGPARLRRDFLVGAGIFLLLIVITFFARRVYQEPTPDITAPATPPTSDYALPEAQTRQPPQADVTESNLTPTSPETEARQPVATPTPTRRTRPLVPEESSVELPDALFTDNRIISHHMERVRITPPVRLTLMARDNVVIQPITNGQQGASFNLTVAEARIWTVQGDLLLRTTAIELLRGDLNGVPIDLGQARGIGALRVTPTGEYEVFAYSNSITAP